MKYMKIIKFGFAIGQNYYLEKGTIFDALYSGKVRKITQIQSENAGKWLKIKALGLCYR